MRPNDGRRQNGMWTGWTSAVLIAGLAGACGGAAPPPPPVPKGDATPAVVVGKIDKEARLLPPEGHLAGVTCLSFSPDGRWLLSGSNDATLLVWDLQSRRVVRRLVGHVGFVRKCAFLPDGQHIVSGGGGGEVLVWDLAAGERRTLGEPARQPWDVYALSVRPDGREVLVGTDYGFVRAYDVTTGNEMFRNDTLACASNRCTAWTVGHGPGGSRFAGTDAGGVVVWGDNGRILRRVGLTAWSGIALPDGALLLGANNDVIESRPDGSRRLIAKQTGVTYGLALSARDDLLLAGDITTGTARLWSVAEASLRCEISADAGIQAAALDPKGDWIAVGSMDGSIRVARLEECVSGARPPTTWLQAARGRVLPVAASQRILAGDGTGRISTWEPFRWERTASVTAHAGEVIALAAVPDGTWASAGQDFTITRLGKKIGEVAGTPAAIALTPDGSSVHVVDSGGNWTSFPSAGGAGAPILAAKNSLQAVAVRPGQKEAMAGGAVSTLFRKDLVKGGLSTLPIAQAPPDSVTALAYSPDGRWFSEGTTHGHVFLRDADSGKIQRSFHELTNDVFGLIFAGDDLWASDRAGHLRRWPLEDGADPDARFDEPSGLGRLASTSDSQFLIEGLFDGRTRVRSLPDGQLVADLLSLRDGSWAAILADGTTKRSAQGDAHALLFELPNRHVVRLDGTEPEPDFGKTVVTPVASGAFSVRTTVFSPSGLPAVLLDGRWPVGAVRPSTSVALAYDVDVLVHDPQRGSHWLEIDRAGLGTLRVDLGLGPDLRKTRALLIGNESYADFKHDIPDVPGARRDADSMAEVLRSRGSWALPGDPGSSRLQVLKNQQDSELRKAITSFFAQAQPGETLLFYFAGHGLARPQDGKLEGALLPTNFDRAHPETALTASELWKAIAGSSASNVLLVLDACRTGAFALPADLLGAEVEAGRGATKGPRVGLLAATNAAKNAQGTASGGVLTQALVDAMKSPASADPYTGVLTLARAFDEIRKVPAALEQSPRLFGVLDNDIVLAWPPRDVLSSVTTPSPAAPGDWIAFTPTVRLLRQVDVERQRVDRRADGDRNLVLGVFFAHDTDSLRISITYPDPDATKALRLEAFASGFSKGGKATTSEEISLLLQKDLFPTTGEHTVTLQPCNKRVTKDSTSQEKKDACGSEPAKSVKIQL